MSKSFAANASAVDRPIPLLAPVIKATLPLMSDIACLQMPWLA
jgi:hypothetical protein